MQGDTVGDFRVFSNDLYDADNVHIVGTDKGFCVRTVVGQRMECTWTGMFAYGTIVCHGPGLDAVFRGRKCPISSPAVSANYVGAKGEVKIKKLDGHDHQIT